VDGVIQGVVVERAALDAFKAAASRPLQKLRSITHSSPFPPRGGLLRQAPRRRHAATPFTTACFSANKKEKGSRCLNCSPGPTSRRAQDFGKVVRHAQAVPAATSEVTVAALAGRARRPRGRPDVGRNGGGPMIFPIPWPGRSRAWPCCAGLGILLDCDLVGLPKWMTFAQGQGIRLLPEDAPSRRAAQPVRQGVSRRSSRPANIPGVAPAGRPAGPRRRDLKSRGTFLEPALPENCRRRGRLASERSPGQLHDDDPLPQPTRQRSGGSRSIKFARIRTPNALAYGPLLHQARTGAAAGHDRVDHGLQGPRGNWTTIKKVDDLVRQTAGRGASCRGREP